MALAQPQRAVAALEESEKRFPREAGPSLELAQAYTQTGRFDDALAACDRALGKSEGMTTLAGYSAREQILRLKGDTAAAEQTRAEAQQFACALPAPVAGSMVGPSAENR
jgi:tetratricopeptide (TPR) repeat protein